ncbi:hypothetical protein HMPREF1407_00548 [Helicobacter pylori GAM244Ai]|nr:hypothetical protein HMPREF1407_00548 [Helicobacter pylori GAM244Ai]
MYLEHCSAKSFFFLSFRENFRILQILRVCLGGMERVFRFYFNGTLTIKA